MHFADKRYIDWAVILVLGRPPVNLAEDALGLFTHLVWVGVLGIVLAYVMKFFTSQYYLLKALIVTIFIFFVFNAIPSLLGTPFLRNVTFNTALSYTIGTMLWGLTTAYVLMVLDKMGYKEPLK